MTALDKQQILNQLKIVASPEDTVYELIKRERKFVLLELIDCLVDILAWGGLTPPVEPEESEQDELVYLVVSKIKIFLVSIKDNKIHDLTKLEDWEVDLKKEIRRFSRGSYVYKVNRKLELNETNIT